MDSKKNSWFHFFLEIFFEKEESTKLFRKISFLFRTVSIVILIIVYSKGLSIYKSLGIIFLLVGVASILDGIQHYLNKENKRRYISDIGITMIFFITSFILLR